MFGNAHFDRVHQMFADQFEPDGTGYLYRRNLKAPPVRVSTAERDLFIDEYKRSLRKLSWLLVPATLLLIVALVALGPESGAAGHDVALYGGLAAIILPFVLVHHWMWGAPARSLDRRPVVGAARPRGDLRRIMLQRMGYGQFVSGMVIGGLLVLKGFDKADPFHGWNILWIAFGGVLALASAVQALSKWRAERDGME